MNNDDDISRNFVWLAAFALLALVVASPGWMMTIIVLCALYLMLTITNTMARAENKTIRESRKERYRKQAKENELRNV